MIFILHIKSSLNLGRSFSLEYTVLSSAKLQISNFSTKNKMSLINMLNNGGPSIDPWVIPRRISDYLLYKEPTLVLCFLKLR